MSAIKEDLDQFVERLQAAAGPNVESVVLYGSAARSDFNEQYSDLNLLVVLSETRGASLDQLVPLVEWWTKKRQQRPPLFITEDELRTSADVFAIETLDIKESHRVLAGRDVVASIEVPMNLHRVQLEHELRTVLLKLRQHYLLARNDEHELQHALAKSASSIMTLFRHALIALGKPVSDSRRGVVAQIAELDGIDGAPLNAALDLREGRRVEAGIDTLYHRYMDSVAALVRHIDRAAPKQQWRRASAPSSPERIG
jgi:predicted nucleotidyltransferase